MKLKSNTRSLTIPNYIDTLDGFRTIATVLVMLFHYWQQSWVYMSISIGSCTLDFTPIISIGSLGVEMLFVLSGFCLYYPLAMNPDRKFSVGSFAYKRMVRILPSYLLCLLICTIYQIGKMDPALLREQFIGNVTLTQMMTQGLAYNRINGVLWSIAIEVQFYIIFPLILPLFKKKPYLVMLVAFLIGESWRMYLRDIDHSQINWLMNQLPGVIDVFIAGMLAAHIVAQLKRELNPSQQRSLRPMFTLCALMFAMVYIFVTMYINSLRYNNVPDNLSILQMHTRKVVVIAFAGAIACSALSSAWMHKTLGNPLTRFGSTISYQLYLWHMWIALRLKDFHIPQYVTERPMDDAAWRFPYLMLSIALSLMVAVIMTYCYERPITRLLTRHTPRWARAGNAAKTAVVSEPESFPMLPRPHKHDAPTADKVDNTAAKPPNSVDADKHEAE